MSSTGTVGHTAGERGSAVVQFVMVGALVLAVFLALLQLALALHVRNILQDSAAEGARAGGIAGATPADAATRTRYLITLALPSSFAADVTASRGSHSGVAVIRVDVRATLPIVGLTGTGPVVTVSAHAIDEDGLP